MMVYLSYVVLRVVLIAKLSPELSRILLPEEPEPRDPDPAP